MTSFCIVLAALATITIVAIPAMLGALMLETHRRRHAEELDVPSSGRLAPISIG